MKLKILKNRTNTFSKKLVQKYATSFKYDYKFVWAIIANWSRKKKNYYINKVENKKVNS